MARKTNYRSMSISELTKTIENLTQELGRALEALGVADEARANALQTLARMGISLGPQRGVTSAFTGSTSPIGVSPGHYTAPSVQAQLPPGVSAADFDDMEVYVRPMQPGEDPATVSTIPGLEVAPLAAPGEAVTVTNNVDEIQRQIQARLEQLEPTVDLDLA